MENTTHDTRNPLYSTISRASEIVLDLVIFLLAGGYITLVLIRKTFRSNHLNWPTVNIALTTALFVLVHLIFTFTHLQNWSIVSCRIQGFLVDMTACQMMYAYCTSSFTRLLVIRYFTKPIFRSSSWLSTSIIISWLAGFLSAIPHALYDNFACMHRESPILFKVYTCVTTILLPVLIVSLCNISIFRYIKQASRRIHHANNNYKNTGHHMSNKRDLRLTKIMFLTFSLFLLGWMPILLQGLFLTSDHQLPPVISIILELILPMTVLGQMILLIYANQPICQFLKEKLKHNNRFLYIIKLS